MASFLGKEGESAKMNIPPLSSSFLFAGFINPEMIQGDEEEVLVDITEMIQDTGPPPFPYGQTLNNWISIELPVVFKFQNE